MSTLAPAAVVRRATAKRAGEFHSEQVKPQSMDPVRMPELGAHLDHLSSPILPVTDFKKEYADRLAFDEEPLKILIHRSGEKKAPQTTDLVAINGIKAEILFKNGWVQIGYLPRGQAFMTKRKYVEQIARAKMVHVNHYVLNPEKERPDNMLEQVPTALMAFSVLSDQNPRGQEWLEKILYERG